MKRIVALVLLLMGVAHADGESRRRAVGKPASGGTLAVANYIDTHIGAKLTAAGIVPAAIANVSSPAMTAKIQTVASTP